MQVGDILMIKTDFGNKYCIATYINNIGVFRGAFMLMFADGSVHQTYRKRSEDKIISSHNGNLKAGMAEFMDKYYKGE
jgi:hypothetical protein